MFRRHEKLTDAIPMPSAAEVCVLDHVRAVMSVPHDAQESLSSERTPTLSYSIPFYHSIIDEWKCLKIVYPLLSPFIGVGIRKVEEYIDKSGLSCTYLLAMRKPFIPLPATSCADSKSSVLNPCLKMDWIEENCSVDVVNQVKNMALDAVGPVQ